MFHPAGIYIGFTSHAGIMALWSLWSPSIGLDILLTIPRQRKCLIITLKAQWRKMRIQMCLFFLDHIQQKLPESQNVNDCYNFCINNKNYWNYDSNGYFCLQLLDFMATITTTQYFFSLFNISHILLDLDFIIITNIFILNVYQGKTSTTKVV